MLSESQIRSAKPKKKEYALSDGGGLYLYVLPTGTKVWRFRYVMNGKPKRVVIGKYPTITTAEACAQSADFQSKILHGIDLSMSTKPPTFEPSSGAIPHL